MKNTIKYISVEEALQKVRSGDHLHWSCAAAAPEYLIQELVARGARREIRDIHISHLYTEGYADYVLPQYEGIFHLDSFFVGSNVREATQARRADYIPCSLNEVPLIVRSGDRRSDVVMIMVSDPNSAGNVSMGTSVDYMLAAMEQARCVIAQVNTHMPYTYGDALLYIKDGHVALKNGRHVPIFFVRHDEPLKEAEVSPLTETDIAIGKHTAELIPDGATLQIGIGNIPTAVLSQLGDHKDLGVHSEMFTDDVIPLVESGVINGRFKRTDPGKLVAMFLKGTRKLYDFADRNPDVLVDDVWYTNAPLAIAKNPKVCAINSALQIDLTGQVCADSIGTRIYSGSGGQLDFIIGATYSTGGLPIIAMPSTTKKGVSKIVPMLAPGSGVVTPRTLVQWVITEFGAVNLHGRSLSERCKLLISIAHPMHRDELQRQAKEAGII